MIGLGLVSYGREEYREQALRAIDTHLSGVLDVFTVAFDIAPVARAKNEALTILLDKGCDWIFLSEDDVVVQSERAVTGYIDACVQSGWSHLNFHAHGPGNPGPVEVDGPVTLWPNLVGAWAVFSRESLETSGLFDETFRNAWDHCEHTLRLAADGFTHQWPGVADATGSEEWLTEIPGSIENSSIPHTPEWTAAMQAGRDYWHATYPDTYHLIWPHDAVDHCSL